MIPKTQNAEVISEGSSDDMSFGISMDHQAHVMSILRDRLYTDKQLAVLREYSANAWDANREAGRGDKPIMVIVPTDIEPMLTIRDAGLGLSPEGMRKVYTQYGNSTKRASNGSVGMLGIGSKSGFAYTTNFTITSWHERTKYVYSAVLDASNKGKLMLLHSEPCGDETGVEIQIAVKKQDVHSFHQKACDLFRFFEPRPEINIELPAVDSERLTNGSIITDDSRWIAVMGCVPYRVDLRQLTDVSGFDCDNFDKFGGIMYFNIGDVDVSASREELEYSDTTKRALVDKFNALVDEYVLKTIKSIEDGKGTQWEKRLLAQDLNKLGLAPEGDMFAKWVNIKDEYVQQISECRLWRGSEMAHTVAIEASARLIIQDEFRRSVKGFHLEHYDYLVKPHAKATVQEAHAAALELVKLLKIDGIEVVMLSSLPWSPTHRNGMREPNLKHRVRTFKLRPSNYFQKPYSMHWDAETEREASATDDIYVVLYNFKASYDFYSQYNRDKALAETFGVTMPEVYGYKQTEKKPAAPIGKEYSTWSNSFRKSLMTTANLAMLDLRERAKAADYDYYRNYSYDGVNDRTLAVIKGSLGDKHEIVEFLVAAHEAKKELVALKVTPETLNTLASIANNLGMTTTAGVKKELDNAMASIYAKYPLLKVTGSLLNIVGTNAMAWLDYIKIVDKVS